MKSEIGVDFVSGDFAIDENGNQLRAVAFCKKWKARRGVNNQR